MACLAWHKGDIGPLLFQGFLLLWQRSWAYNLCRTSIIFEETDPLCQAALAFLAMPTEDEPWQVFIRAVTEFFKLVGSVQIDPFWFFKNLGHFYVASSKSSLRHLTIHTTYKSKELKQASGFLEKSACIFYFWNIFC